MPPSEAIAIVGSQSMGFINQYSSLFITTAKQHTYESIDSNRSKTDQ